VRRRVQLGVITLIAVISVGLGISAIRSTRHAAEKTHCVNNLRQLGLALHNYAGTGFGFPKAVFGNPSLPPEQRLSWILEIDPFIESHMDPERTKYRNEPWDSEANQRIARQGLRSIHCPGCKDMKTAEGYTLTTYVGVTGLGPGAAMYSKEDARAGFFGFDRRIMTQDVKDGLESTIAVIETNFEKGPFIAGGRPTSRPLLLGDQNLIGPFGQFGGFHRDGLNVCLGDASVRFLRDSIDRETLAAMFTIAGGDPIGAMGDQ
jgi:hypothetical protein